MPQKPLERVYLVLRDTFRGNEELIDIWHLQEKLEKLQEASLERMDGGYVTYMPIIIEILEAYRKLFNLPSPPVPITFGGMEFSDEL